tara:strand:- start:35 stop:595 length:561 start_codon:yes stop_codon:yes gene_type:complete
MRIIRPQTYNIERTLEKPESEWVVMLQNITREPENIRDQFGEDERIWSPELEESFGIRAIIFVDNENDMVSGWEIHNLTYDGGGDFRQGMIDKNGNSVPKPDNVVSKLLNAIKRGTWNRDLLYGDLGIELHNLTVVEEIEEDWEALSMGLTYKDPSDNPFWIMVPDFVESVFDTINCQSVPQLLGR